MSKLHFGKINNVILIGGGYMLVKSIEIIQSIGFELTVITSQKQENETFSQYENISLGNYLINNNINYIISRDINNDTKVKNLITSNTIGFSINSRWIIKKELIKYFRRKLVNIHGSDLPLNKGGGGHSWKIMSADKYGGICIHLIDEGIDTGGIILRKDYNFSKKHIKPVDYSSKTDIEMESLIKKFFNIVRNSKFFTITNQNVRYGTYWPRLSSSINGYIDWSWQTKHIHRFICAFDDPYEGSKSYIGSKLVFLKDSFIYDLKCEHHPFQAGIIVRKYSNHFYIATVDGIIRVSRIFRKDDEIIKINQGDRLYTPSKKLDESKNKRIYYRP